jgi:hypothetical protein
MNGTCDREEEVLDAVAAQRWPHRCEDELRAHLNSCHSCADLADVAAALLEDRNAAWSEARVPPPGVVWWRAQLRARVEDAKAAGRPVAFVQGVAASVAVWLIVALFRALPAGLLSGWRLWAASVIPAVTSSMADLAGMTAAIPLMVFVIVGASLLLAPVAIYFAIADK